MIIDIKNISVHFGSNIALNNINITLNDVGVIALLGSSGCGKTTFLRTIAGLEKPKNGEIYINHHKIPYDDKRIDTSDVLREYRKHIGVVFQAHNLLPHLNALQNITLPLIKVHKYTKKQAKDRAEELLHRFSLHPYMHQLPHQLSGGQKQRVAICRALAPSPEFLLFDEPTSSLDPDFVMEVLETIKELKSLCDFIVVTHHIGFAKSIADYIVFLDKGAILAHATPDVLFTQSLDEKIKKFFDNALY